jgi:hypothetical protein
VRLLVQLRGEASPKPVVQSKPHILPRMKPFPNAADRAHDDPYAPDGSSGDAL